MDDVIARMRAADQRERAESHAAGRAAGERWAKGEATPRELRRLDRFGESSDAATWEAEVAEMNDPANGGAGVLLARVITGDPGLTDAADVWDGMGVNADDLADDSFAVGFVTAAVEVWEAVKDKL